MRRKWYLIAPAAIAGIIVFSFLGGEVVKLLWNWLLPPLFGFRQVTFWQAFGLLALSRILFGGWGRGGYGGNGSNAARQYGYQDGINDGARDRRTGHSNRPTQDSNYKHADRGYSSLYGNKDYYKQAYRQAYENGYQQGYNSGGGYRRGPWWRF